jgi:16S rRNA (guanine527-N7)-methyltransferase
LISAVPLAPAPEADSQELLASLTPAKVEQLAAYVELLLRATQDFNLTAIRDHDEAWKRHVLETLRLLAVLPEGSSLIDVGSGGGIPGMVLAIARPSLSVTLLEATTKKVRFLEATGKTLGLSNLRVVDDRAETAAAVGSPYREAFDIVTARAVAPLRVLLELTVPFAKVGGHLLAVKGERAQDELAEASRARSTLQVELTGTHRHPTATLLLFEKTGPTPKKYPRRPGEPKKTPL